MTYIPLIKYKMRIERQLRIRVRKLAWYADDTTRKLKALGYPEEQPPFTPIIKENYKRMKQLADDLSCFESSLEKIWPNIMPLYTTARNIDLERLT